jgi:hypothetical protein
MDFQTLFDILMNEYLDRHSPEGRIKRRNALKRCGSIAGSASDRKRGHHPENTVSERTGELHRSTGRNPV